MTYTRAERDLLVTALSRLLRDARLAPAVDIEMGGPEADPDLIEALRDKVRADTAGPDLHIAAADLGPGFLAVGNTAEQARAALAAALRRYADDLYLTPGILDDVAVRTFSGRPGTAFRDDQPYPAPPDPPAAD